VGDVHGYFQGCDRSLLVEVDNVSHALRVVVRDVSFGGRIADVVLGLPVSRGADIECHLLSARADVRQGKTRRSAIPPFAVGDGPIGETRLG
jgi:hypothetical protein